MITIDLRSDTLTKPSEPMRRAMYDAEVGDDVFGEDPTAIRLQERAAEMTGKPAALFVSSGSMGNIIALYINCGRGGEVLAHEGSHIVEAELASPAAIAGVLPIGVPGRRGILEPEALIKRLRPGDYYMARVRMISLENSHNKEGGSCYSREGLREVASFAEKHELIVHMDGARVFNASTATGITVFEIAENVDTISFCLSKGLGAPAGSMLCGSKEFIEEARHVRKLLGGGMRQVGVLAAAGLYALENNVARLGQDHENAKALAAALAETSWAEIDPAAVETNILHFDTPHHRAEHVIAALESRGIRCFAPGDHSLRFVTHLDVSEDDCRQACEIIRTLAV